MASDRSKERLEMGVTPLVKARSLAVRAADAAERGQAGRDEDGKIPRRRDRRRQASARSNWLLAAIGIAVVAVAVAVVLLVTGHRPL